MKERYCICGDLEIYTRDDAIKAGIYNFKDFDTEEEAKQARRLMPEWQARQIEWQAKQIEELQQIVSHLSWVKLQGKESSDEEVG
jgi:hypothetical protein